MDSPNFGAEASPSAPQPPVVRAGESLTGPPIRFIGKETYVKLAAGSGACPLTVLEDASPAHHGPPFHKHAFEEFFYILTGEYLFEVDGKQLRAFPGDFVYAPANVPHVFQNITDRTATMLIIVRPGGLENYFMEVAEKLITDPSDVAGLNVIAARYGITILGPPMAARPR